MPARRRFRRGLVAAAAAAAALTTATVAGAAPATPPPDTSPPGTPPPDTLPPGTEPAPEPARYEWSRLRDPVLASTVAGGEFTGITDWNGGFASYGFSVEAGGAPVARAWTSVDGTAWAPLELPASPSGGFLRAGAWSAGVGVLIGTGGGSVGHPLVYRVDGSGATLTDASGLPVNSVPFAAAANRNGGFVAGGTADGEPFVAQSADGVTWQVDATAGAALATLVSPGIVSIDSGPLGQLVVVHHSQGGIGAGAVLVDAGAGFQLAALPESAEVDVAGGLVTDTGFFVYGGVRTGSAFEPAIWQSADGVSWSRIDPTIELSPDHRSTNTFGEELLDAIRIGDRYYATFFGQASYLVVTSTDGQSWAEVANATDALDTALPGFSGLATNGANVVATSSYAPVIWSVTDAVRQVVDPSLLTSSDSLVPRSVVAVNEYLMIGGEGYLQAQDLDEPEYVRGEVWTVAPGPAVTKTDQLPGAEVRSLVTLDDGSVRALGYDEFNASVAGGFAAGARAWSTWPGGPMSEMPVPDRDETNRMFSGAELSPGVLVAGGSTFIDSETTPMFWVSADAGLSWQIAGDPEDSPLPGYSPSGAVCRLPNGGAVSFGSVSTQAGTAPVAHTTADGQSWQVAVGDASPFGAAVVDLEACASGPDGVVVVGSAGSPATAAAWSTADGSSYTPLATADLGAGSAWWDVSVGDDGRVWLVGQGRAAASSGFGAVLQELGADGSAQPAVDLAGAAFESPLGTPDVWYVQPFGASLALVGRDGYDVAVWLAPLPPA